MSSLAADLLPSLRPMRRGGWRSPVVTYKLPSYFSVNHRTPDLSPHMQEAGKYPNRNPSRPQKKGFWKTLVGLRCH